MHIESTSGSFVDLSVVRYEFAGGDNEWDLNWLLVRGRVRTPDRAWEFEDPCMLVSEAASLGSWLRQVTNPSAELERLTFTEPNVWFDVPDRSETKVTIRVGFELEARPPEDRSGRVGEDECWVDLDTNVDALLSASKSWLRELESFPVRKP